MVKRLITGTLYIAVIVAFFMLRRFVDYRLFQILPFLFCAIGTFEVARAVKDKISFQTYILAVVCGIIFVPIYCVFLYIKKYSGYAYLFPLLLDFYCVIVALIFTKVEKEKSVSYGYSVLTVLYPSLLLLTTVLANDLKYNSLIALVLIFVISPCSDTMAYLTGLTFQKIKKGNAKKLCPKLSPKKTWAGAIGGVVGGIAGAVIVYFIYRNETVNINAPLPFFIIVGAVASVLTELGDLFESFIKRSVGIKDIGKLLPGHGGIMDRIDGMSFASVFIYLMFLIV